MIAAATLPAGAPPPVRVGPPSYQEVRAELDEALHDLRDRLGPSDRLDAASRAAMDRIQSQASHLTPDHSVHAKWGLRQALWTLRQSYELAPQGNPPLDVRRSFERMRAVCLDNTWERSLRAIPSAEYVVRPRMSQVPNFLSLERHVLRGGEPTQDGADWLVGQGNVAAVIDLTVPATDEPWAPVEWKNVKHYSIPVQDYQAPTYEQTMKIIDILDSASEGGNVFIHCKAGIGRTGVAIACWRVTHGWSVDDAIASEALNSYDASLSQAQAVRDFAQRWYQEHLH